MSDPRQYLRDRGLADDAPREAPQPFPFAFSAGEVVPAESAESAVPPIDLPNDYAARVLAVEHAPHYLDADAGIDDALTAIHRLHAFLTATEVPETKLTIHTDE